MKPAFVLAALFMASTAHGQEDLKFLAIHAGCVVEYSLRYVGTKESPHDIATAALVPCREYLEDGLTKAGVKGADSRRAIITDLEEKALRLAMRGILETRYPGAKK